MRAWDDGFARRALYSIVQSSGREQLGQTFELVGINQCRESTGVAGYSLFLDVHLGSFGILQHSQSQFVVSTTLLSATPSSRNNEP